MPFALPKLHRPDFVKQVPELNALTSKGAREANAAINDARPANRTVPLPRSLLGQYRARVSVLREIAGRQAALVATLPVEGPEVTSAPATQHTSPLPIMAPATQQSPTLPTPTAETLDLIVESALAGEPSTEVVTRLRSTSREMRERVDAYMRRPEHRELACRMTRNSITRMANSLQLSDEQFREQVTHLICRNTHIGLDLGRIDLPERRQIVLDCLAAATHLHTVDLDTNEIEANFPAVLAATTALSAANPHLIRLQLAVQNSHIGDAGAQALAAIPVITYLDLTHNHIGVAGAQALAANTTITQLKMRWNRIGDAGAQALAANTTIRELELSDNNISAAGAQALAANSTVKQLNVYGNHIGAAGAQALAANATITELDVSNNNIGDAGTQALAANTTITQLDVSHNNIGPVGAQALAANTTLTHLDIGWNHIGAAGAQALAANATITTLNVRGNDIGDVGVEVNN